MSADPENFDRLRKLLAVKRHEQPPPGYFDQFASEVMARLRAGEQYQSDVLRDLNEDAPWVQRLLGLFSARPAMAGAFGVMACGVLLAGIYYSQQSGESVAGGSASVVATVHVPLPVGALALSEPVAKPAMNSSTNPVFGGPPGGLSTPSLFDRIGVPGQAAAASFTPLGAK
jgi:hypothetical protein